VETLSCIRTVLRLAEKVLDGCPIWGPKAAIAVTEEGLKSVQVRFYGSPFQNAAHLALQTSLENERAIEDVVAAVQKTVELLAPSVPVLPASVSPELKSRIWAHISCVLTLRGIGFVSSYVESWRPSAPARRTGRRRRRDR
jgi:hypothetical protein